MAKIISHIASSMRGSIAGITYLTTPAGAIIARQRVIPVHQPTPNRTMITNAMENAVMKWDGLSHFVRQEWQFWAAIYGKPRSGRQLFIGGNALTHYMNNVPLISGTPPAEELSAPQFTNVPAIALVAVEYTTPGSTGFGFKITNNTPYQVVTMVEISGEMNAARNYYKGPWQTDWHMLVTSAAAATSSHMVEFGNTAGNRVFVRARAVSDSDSVSEKGRVVSPVMYCYSTLVTNA